jgi:TRAP-type C4-dicarboxylate transport system permease small subunit
MRPRTIFGILLVLVAFVAFGSALIAVGSQQVAEAFGCQVDLNRAIPCVIGGKDYGQTFYDLGFWYSYLSLPAGLVLLGVWALAALIGILVGWRRQNRPPSEPLSPGKSFLRGAAIAIALAFSPVAVTYTAGLIALLIGCDLNEASVHPCPLLGVNIGPLLYGMGLAVWFVSLTVLAGLLALVVLVIIFIVRTLRARRAKVDAAGAKA